MIKHFILSVGLMIFYALKTIVEYQNNGYILNFYGFITFAWLVISVWTLVLCFREKKLDKEMEKEEQENE